MKKLLLVFAVAAFIFTGCDDSGGGVGGDIIATYTVTFDANGADETIIAPPAQTADSGTGIILPTGTGLSKTGYTFGGWNTKADGAGTTYSAGSSYKVTDNIILYAKWLDNSYPRSTVTYNANGADGLPPAPQAAYTDSTITIPNQGALVKTGYSFGGWNTKADGTGTYYFAGSSYTVTGNITLYAMWEVGNLPGDYYELIYEFNYNRDFENGVNNIGTYRVIRGSSTIPNNVYIPAEYNGLPVTEIGEYAFNGRTNITSIHTPDSMTYIGDGAFSGCTGLTSLTIPSGVTSIGDYVFYDCTGLTSITIPSSVTSIGSWAFRECTGLTSITIPDSVTEIGEQAFAFTGLTSITIPSSVTSIGDSAFWGCTGLTSVTIPSSVTSISNSAFSGCTGLTSVTIPSSVTSIGDSAFSDCTGLTSITIPSSVTSIGGWVFSGCTGLTSITIPSSVTSIGNSAFYSWGWEDSQTINIQGHANQAEADAAWGSSWRDACNATINYLGG
jgi:uncharacterized repeat protein (TIGR02543 family)